MNYREKSEDHLRTLEWSQCKTMQIQTSTTAVKRKTEPCEDILMGLGNQQESGKERDNRQGPDVSSLGV